MSDDNRQWLTAEEISNLDGTIITVTLIRERLIAGEFPSRRRISNLIYPYSQEYFINKADISIFHPKNKKKDSSKLEGMVKTEESKLRRPPVDQSTGNSLRHQVVNVQVPPKSYSSGPPPLTLQLNGIDVEIYSDRIYGRQEAARFLRMVHSGVFENGVTLERMLNHIGSGDRIRGESIYRELKELNGMMPYSSKSAHLKLESEFGLTYEVLSSFLESSEGSSFVHRLEGVIDEPFLLKGEFPDIQEALRAPHLSLYSQEDTSSEEGTHEGGKDYTSDPDIRQVLYQWQRALRDKRIMPSRKPYDVLKSLGVLDERSVSNIVSSYSIFLEQMEGFQLYNLYKLNKASGLGWEPFFNTCMKRLEELHLAKNIVSAVGLDRDKFFYVIAIGKVVDAYRALGLSDPA